MKRLTLFFVICIGLLIGCKKETGPATKTENPIKTTIAAKSVVDTNFVYDFISNLEEGYKFYPSRDGKITKLGCQMRNKGTYVVSLWNFATASLIAATSVNVTDTVNFFYNSISPTSITANTRYVVSIYIPAGSLYNVYFKKSGSTRPIIYPFTSGSITFEERREVSAISTSTFPTNIIDQWAMVGVPDIQFEYTE